jgi:hypothetical protein
MPTRFCSSGPEMPSVAGTKRSLPPILFHSSSPSLTKAPVENAVGVKVVPTAYTSGPMPDTTDVWILVSSSLAVAKVSNFTVAPVCALNLSLMDFCQAANSSGYWVLAPISMVSVLPSPPLPLPPPSSPPPQAVSVATSATAPASAITERLFVKLIVVSPLA